MQIYTDRLILCNFKQEYAEWFTTALKDPRIFDYLQESVPDIDDIKKLIQRFIERDLKNVKNEFVGTNLVIILKELKKLSGGVDCNPLIHCLIK